MRKVYYYEKNTEIYNNFFYDNNMCYNFASICMDKRGEWMDKWYHGMVIYDKWFL
ncbi:MAG: amidase domain-containing protein [Clostridium butyricum]|nr:amidase domain-containing protein [Clostridium butyricum]